MLKSILGLILAILVDAAHAETIIKKCRAVTTFQGEQAVTEIVILKKNDSRLVASVLSNPHGEKQLIEVSASFAKYEVDQKKFADNDDGDMNTAEKFIAHAIQLEEDPALERSLVSGINLRQVARADLYQFPADDTAGKQAIIVARDNRNKLLGAFLGGFLIAPCR